MANNNNSSFWTLQKNVFQNFKDNTKNIYIYNYTKYNLHFRLNNLLFINCIMFIKSNKTRLILHLFLLRYFLQWS